MTSEISSSGTPENNLQLAYQRLRALERFKSGFLARTSHELRSPINTIVSLSQLILEDLCEGPEEEKEFIAQSKEAALKMLGLFDQITAVSKLDIGREPAKIETVDLSFLLPEVEMLTTLQAANQNIRYTVASPADELEIQTDAKWLKNILVYLVQDAIPNTKFLTTTVNQTEQSIMIAIESDRTQSSLQADLDTISDIDSLPSASNTASETASDHLALSTGLILATAQTALPLINGTFSIEKSPTAEGSQLQLTFPK
ncbi:MAG: HAMP domain-containing sensor histidine kinase [Cyanobacteria bacterium J06621_11]